MSRKLKVDRIQMNKCVCVCIVTNYINEKNGENNNKKNYFKVGGGKMPIHSPQSIEDQVLLGNVVVFIFILNMIVLKKY